MEMNFVMVKRFYQGGETIINLDNVRFFELHFDASGEIIDAYYVISAAEIGVLITIESYEMVKRIIAWHNTFSLEGNGWEAKHEESKLE